MRYARFFLATALLGGLVPLAAACSKEGPAPGAGGPPGGASCDELRTKAAAEAIAVAEKSRACSADDDCVLVEVGASCFDVCTRPVSKAGAEAVKAASAAANSGACVEFTKQGCKLEVPPCMPSQPPKCNAGQCG